MKRHLISFLVLVCVAACDTTTTPPEQTTGGTKVPGVGSVFIHRVDTLDRNGVVRNLSRYDTFKVSATGVSMYGRTNVASFARGTEPIYFSYESNGDISMKYDDSTWIAIPIASKGERASTTSKPDHLFRAAYLGEETVLVGTEQILTQKIRVSESFASKDYPPEFYWFSRSIGFLVRFERQAGLQSVSDTVGNRSQLTTYTLK